MCPDFQHSPDLYSGYQRAWFRINLASVKWVSHVYLYFLKNLALSVNSGPSERDSKGISLLAAMDTVKMYASASRALWATESSVRWAWEGEDGEGYQWWILASIFSPGSWDPCLPQDLRGEVTTPFSSWLAKPQLNRAREVAWVEFFATLCPLVFSVLLLIITTWPHTNPLCRQGGMKFSIIVHLPSLMWEVKITQTRSSPRNTETPAKKIPSQNATETPIQPTPLHRRNSWAPGVWDITSHTSQTALLRTGAGRLRHGHPTHHPSS